LGSATSFDAKFTLQPVAELIAEEAAAKLSTLSTPISIDALTPTEAYDSGGRARALAATVEALARAKEAGLSDAAIAAALSSSVGVAAG
jgi:MoaA/NifB/PqqE/SkfB family radical SAM enzyme